MKDCANEELQIILDLLGEWRNKNNVGYVNMNILEDGYGLAHDFNCDNKKVQFQAYGNYGQWIEQKESQDVGASQESSKYETIHPLL